MASGTCRFRDQLGLPFSTAISGGSGASLTASLDGVNNNRPAPADASPNSHAAQFGQKPNVRLTGRRQHEATHDPAQVGDPAPFRQTGFPRKTCNRLFLAGANLDKGDTARGQPGRNSGQYGTPAGQPRG